MELKIKKITKDVDMPNFAYEHDAAFDLRASHDEVIKAKEKKIIKTGLQMAIPKGYVGLIWDRSGMAAKYTLHTLAGVIDSGYRGEVGVVIINLGDEEFPVKKNMRIAQMLIQPIETPSIIEVDNLEDSQRGEGGFGSSGTK
ncbi:MAG: dUTP diphosphatase [Nanobdellota archaeon]